MTKKLPLITLGFFLAAVLMFLLLGSNHNPSGQTGMSEVVMVLFLLLFALLFVLSLVYWLVSLLLGKLKASGPAQGREEQVFTTGEHPEQDYREQDYQKQDSSPKKGWVKPGGIVALILLVFGKAKGILLPLLFLLKKGFLIFKFGKFGATFLSMFLMIWVYSMFYGWKFALGFVLLLFLHENGHLWFAKLKGVPTSLPVFIPFMGAFISMKEYPKDAATEAFLAIGGPLTGGLAALLCWLLYVSTGYPLWAALAYTGFFLNLFNLIPAHPLDGGRVAGVLSPALWLVGIVILAGLTVMRFNPLLLLILFFALSHWWKARKESAQGSAYYQVAPEIRMRWSITYFSLTGFLAYMMVHSLQALEGARQFINS